MHPRRFDSLARSLAAPRSRRGFLGGLAALAAGLTGRPAGAQATHWNCGNVRCAGNPCACKPGCECCVYSNGNSRCLAPGLCYGGTVSACPSSTTTTTTTPAPCPSGTAPCGASCCADCFVERDETGAETLICCPSTSVCAGATGAPGDDLCCWSDEVCLAPNTACCRSDGIGGCVPQTNCAGCCRACGTDGSGDPICCTESEQCGQQGCEDLNTARLSRSRL